ncbi:ATP-binding protein [Zoogloea sp.]|uniref:ATP-binding protein n=1 Tax=Zoogloea sp. TaxID=49181 RepID=UPI00260181A6|nr:ATP-binding protein [Zoogloea sp.]MDD3353909.1 ATP-binding protein [Zoogloea sp.]
MMFKSRTLQIIGLVVLVCILVDARLAQQVLADRDQLLAEAQASLARQAHTTLTRAEAIVDIYDRTLSGIGEAIQFRGPSLEAPDLEMHRLLLRRHAITPYAEWLSLIRPDGRLAEYSMAFPAIPLDLSDRPHFRIPAEQLSGGLFIGARIASRSDNRPVIPVSRAVRDDAGTLMGVVVVGVDPDALRSYLFDAGIPGNLRLSLVLDSGAILACSFVEGRCPEGGVDLAFEVQQASRGVTRQGLLAPTQRIGEDGQLQVTSEIRPLRVVGRYDRAMVLAEWHSRAMEILATALAANLGFLALGLFALRQFQRREKAVAALHETIASLDQRVAERTRRLNLAVEAADIGVWSWRLEDDQLEWDARLRAWYELPEEVQGQALRYSFWRQRVHPDDLARAEAMVKRLLGNGVSVSEEFRIVLPGARIRHIQAACALEVDVEGRPIQIIGINRDVTAQRELEDSLRLARSEAEAADRAKGAFLAMMSHEIRTPMHAILGMTALVLASRLDSSQRDYLEKVQRAGQTLMRLLNDVLDYSKIEAGRMTLERVPFQLSVCLAGVAGLFEFQCREKGLGWQLQVPADLPDWLVGDPLRLEQILTNLLGNALKFTTQGGIALEVGWRAGPAEGPLMLHFRVRDSGIGMTAEQIEGLFSSFTQADSSISRRYGGTGLGLSIVRSLVEMQGGHIEVHSAVGQGSCFTCELPFSPGTAQARGTVAEGLERPAEPEPSAASAGRTEGDARIDPSQVLDLAKSLQGLLAENSYSARKEVRKLESLLAESDLAQAFAGVASAVRRLQFREAEEALQAFMERVLSDPFPSKEDHAVWPAPEDPHH